MGKDDETCDHEFRGSTSQCDGGAWAECAFEWCDVACCGDHYDEVMFTCHECGDTHCYSHGEGEDWPPPEEGGDWVTVYFCDDCQD